MMPFAQPVAYIRRSARSRSDPGDLSREFQTDKVRELANGDAARLRIIDMDWGRSASTDKTDKRTAFLALLADVERGEVSALYAYACDRLARSVEWSARLLNACRRAGTVIVTSEGRFEPDNQLTDQLFYFQAMQNEGYSRQAAQKRQATVVRQRARGDKLGPTFYGSLPGEDLPALLAAFDATGSAHAAARRLNDQKTPTRRGKSWTPSTVRNILIREGRMPKMGTRGAKPRAPFVLYRLLRCHCGRTLTAVTQRYGKDNGRKRVIYRCVSSEADRSHGLATVAASRIMPAIMAEAARLRVPGDQVAVANRQAVDLEAIEAKRAFIVDTYIEMGGKMKPEDRDRRLVALDEEEARLAAAARVLDLPPAIDWTWTPETLNAVLRALWERVELGPDLTPKADGFAWRVPEWRA